MADFEIDFDQISSGSEDLNPASSGASSGGKMGLVEKNKDLEKQLGVARGVSLGLGFGLLGVSLAWMIYEIYAYNIWSQKQNSGKDLGTYLKERMGMRGQGKAGAQGQGKGSGGGSGPQDGTVPEVASRLPHWKLPENADALLQELERQDVITFLFYGSERCPGCRSYTPNFKEAQAFIANHPKISQLVRVWKIGPETFSAPLSEKNGGGSLAQRFGLEAIPTVAAYHAGAELGRLPLDKRQAQDLVNFVDQTLEARLQSNPDPNSSAPPAS